MGVGNRLLSSAWADGAHFQLVKGPQTKQEADVFNPLHQGVDHVGPLVNRPPDPGCPSPRFPTSNISTLRFYGPRARKATALSPAPGILPIQFPIRTRHIDTRWASLQRTKLPAGGSGGAEAA